MLHTFVLHSYSAEQFSPISFFGIHRLLLELQNAVVLHPELFVQKFDTLHIPL